MLSDLIIGHFLSNGPIMPNLGSLCHPHGLEEAPVAHRPDLRQRQWIQKFLREVILCDALYDPTKLKPDCSSHIGVYLAPLYSLHKVARMLQAN